MEDIDQAGAFTKPDGFWKEYAVHNEREIKGFFGDYRFLSNFCVCDVEFEGQLYRSSEAAFQAAKTLDWHQRKAFETMTPGQAKKAGRKLMLRNDWESRKVEIMTIIVVDKFYRNLDLRKRLVDTDPAYLEETNHWNDRFWGVDYIEGGENHLGKILEKVRNLWV